MTILLLLSFGMLAMVGVAALLQSLYPDDEPPEWFDRLFGTNDPLSRD